MSNRGQRSQPIIRWGGGKADLRENINNSDQQYYKVKENCKISGNITDNMNL